MIWNFATVIGETFAIPAQIIMAPATGEIERPMPPESTVMAPIFMMSRPNCGACALTALLKAIEAASPEPQSTAITNGPTIEAPFAMTGDELINSIRAWIRPTLFMPATKILAATMMPKMFPKLSPMPLKKVLTNVPGFGRTATNATTAPMIMACETGILSTDTMPKFPRSKMMSGRSGMME